MGMSSDSLHLIYTNPFVLIDTLNIILLWGILLDGPQKSTRRKDTDRISIPSVSPNLYLDFPHQSYFLNYLTFLQVTKSLGPSEPHHKHFTLILAAFGSSPPFHMEELSIIPI